ncbi:hypothetical protein V6Z12_A05G255600 [Gossypium hirsutum]
MLSKAFKVTLGMASNGSSRMVPLLIFGTKIEARIFLDGI